LTQLPILGSHPHINGLVGRLNWTLEQMLSEVETRGGGKDWDELLAPALGRDPGVPTSNNFYQPAM